MIWARKDVPIECWKREWQEPLKWRTVALVWVMNRIRWNSGAQMALRKLGFMTEYSIGE